MIIKKKTWTDAFEKILSGEKTFDARLADFDCKVGDTLVLEEYDPKKKMYTGRKIEKKINYVLNTKTQKFWTQKEIMEKGILIMGIDN